MAITTNGLALRPSGATEAFVWLGAFVSVE